MLLHVTKLADETAPLPADRQRNILDRLSRDGQVNASLLAMEFSTSEDTIRRDLRNLSAQGLCQRVYGGAVLMSPASASIAIRADESNARKKALGRTLATLLQPRQFLFIDAGSTNLAFARMIPAGLQLTIATHDPSIAACLVGKPEVELIVVGGIIHPEIGAALGGRAMQEIAGMRPDLLVLGACSFHVDHGVGAFNFEDAQMKNVLIQNAGSVALALLNEKLRSVAKQLVSPIDSISDVVVEVDAPLSETDAFVQAGLRVHRADAAISNSRGQNTTIRTKLHKEKYERN
jgi:DeoR/GlpR family transcriptional regulator of sugar metabolism